MNKKTLAEYLESSSQQALADEFGLVQSAISKMKLSERNIYFIAHDDGSLELREEKTIAFKKAPEAHDQDRAA